MLRNGLAMLWRWTFRLFALLMLVAGSYALAVAVGASYPANRGWVMANSGVRIHVIDNGIHTDLVLPLVAEGVDWRDLVKPEDIADPRQAAQSHIALGWGDRDFYLNTPSWSKIDPQRTLAALTGRGSTVLHVVHLAEPPRMPQMRTILLRPEEYHRLAAFVRGTFAEGPSVRGYGSNDAFYPAKGGYSAINTCNAWTGQALRAAGVTMGSWTPFPFGVMRWL
ncbi:TIGR02117 family protein [Sphingomonas sp. AOB5]|uniref:TIGR02117 family protein n=1 Tax=Sphingomonas sp. AOB5 TaxID=3034017 RepID=UPI0023F8E592|nr:TIGR02117 family protein [Sphingomonas sp. AOB5]MDF7775839.1 TIGR02117 family protein [Sphingomonas sp. AOB5]